jgi:hypothetical protein
MSPSSATHQHPQHQVTPLCVEFYPVDDVLGVVHLRNVEGLVFGFWEAQTQNETKVEGP